MRKTVHCNSCLLYTSDVYKRQLYNQVANQASQVSEFMNNSLDAAVNAILAASNQSVIINGAGITIGNGSNYQIRMVNEMIAITGDGWSTAKVAIGHFTSEEIGDYFGVNAEVIGGKLIVGNNLVIENTTDDGIMQFKVDSSGVWLNNSTFVLQKDNGGKILIDPRYGIVAGNENIYQTSGTTVYPSFVDDNGDISFDGDGMPENTNFYLDICDGNAYFRGRLFATSGDIGGFTIADDYLYTSSSQGFVALNGSKTNANSIYAIWVGAESPGGAPFWVKKDGSMKAVNAVFSGTINASKLAGDLTADDDTDGWLRGCGISVGGNYKFGVGNFYVDQNGNVTMKGSINLSDGNITWGTSNSPVRVLYARTLLSAPTLPYSSYPSSSTTGWHQTMSVAYDYYVSYSYDGGNTWTAAIVVQGKDGEDGQDGADGSDATVNERNVFNVLTNGGTKFGIFNDSTSNKLYINANYIQTGTLNADLIELSCSYGGFCKGHGSDGVRTTYGAMMYGANGSANTPFVMVTDAGAIMRADGCNIYVSGSSIVASTEIEENSDRRIKNKINYDIDKYVDFYMSLKPTSYCFNNGNSGRTHLGFIAQDVEDALVKNGLTTKDFAGLTITPVEEVDSDDGISDYHYRLRYGQFISLNTYMIQKLYQRIAELESRLNAMN